MPNKPVKADAARGVRRLWSWAQVVDTAQSLWTWGSAHSGAVVSVVSVASGTAVAAWSYLVHHLPVPVTVAASLATAASLAALGVSARVAARLRAWSKATGVLDPE